MTYVLFFFPHLPWLLHLPRLLPIPKHHLFGYVDGSIPCPPQTIVSTKDGVTTTSPNPAFLHWSMQDQLILGAINFSLTEKMLSHVTRCATSREAWTTLATLFASQSQARTTQVHYQLATLKKGNSNIADYYQKFQTLTDTLAAVGQPLNDFVLVSFLLTGLVSEYDPFVTSITTRVEPLSIEEIYGHLLTHELQVEQHQSSLDLSVAWANFASRRHSQRGARRGCSSSTSHTFSGRGHFIGNSSIQYSGRGRGLSSSFGHGNSHNSSSQSTRPVCQVCNRMGHIALDCYNRFNESFSRETNPPIQAYHSAPSSTSDPNWYPDSSATHHLTSEIDNLNVKADEYLGSDQIRVGNGNGLSNKHVGNACIFFPNLHFDLLDILHVPQISKNLISVHKFTKDTNTFFNSILIISC